MTRSEAFLPGWQPAPFPRAVLCGGPRRSPSCTRRPVSMRSSEEMQMAPPRRLPVCCVDVMDTLVVDPFSRGMAHHFGFDTFADFLAAKKDGTWVQFELGRMTEEELSREFFRDPERRVDINAFKRFLRDSYQLVPGMADLLEILRESQIEVHAFSNYPMWYLLVEEKLRLQQRGVKWTYVSAVEGARKPDRDAYLRVARNANVHVRDCVLLDDRKVNCEAALEAGFRAAVLFESAAQAEAELRQIYKSSSAVSS